MSKYLILSGQIDRENSDDNLSYAELWVRIHQKSPSLLSDGTPLSEFVRDHPQVLGGECKIHPTKDEKL